MKLTKLKLTLEDLKSKEGEVVAVISGSLYVDDEVINFMTALDTEPELKKVLQDLCLSALSLKKKEADVEFKAMFKRTLPKRVSKTRSKKK